jgi:hypothetical protein
MAGALSNKIKRVLRPVRLPQANTKKLIQTYNKIVAQDTIKQKYIIKENSARFASNIKQYYQDPLDLIFQRN